MIEWELIGKSLKELGPSRQRWVTKHASGNCGIGDTLFRWRQQLDPLCSLCQLENETNEHVLQRPDPVAKDQRERSLNELESWMNTNYTDPQITSSILTAVKAWMERSDIEPPDTSDPLITAAFTEQCEIGWFNLLMGLLAKKWMDCQHKYLESIGRKRSSKRWLVEIQKKLINISWDCWSTRCAERWKPGNHRDQVALQELDEIVLKELEIGITPDFPLRSRHLFEESNEDMMRYSVRRKSYWLLSVEAARYYSIAAPLGRINPNTPLNAG